MSKPPPLWRTFLAFLLPMMLSNILQALFGTINNIYLGQMIGASRGMGRLSDHLLHHVPAADGLLHAGLAEADHPAFDLTGTGSSQ
ncbi:hypothetical protein [Bradyrhizobium cenepequi]|uniref:hypothetical protein n=1 Tax=Bradyrhizobium cenepequi TaxID=2821403 RepID=UPI001CE2F4CB|nr:hypothetical protein [Bradyrhizobium cenepequi]MCA6111455.1 hypothetical protein [Bradyrhizobium cenepequi]